VLLGGRRVFPITLANGPPRGGRDPVSGADGWAEVAAAGVKMLRIYPKWDVVNVDEQLKVARRDLAAAAGTKPGLRLWVGLYNAADGLGKRALLDQIVDGLKNEPGLGAWKGADEPLWGRLKAPALVAAYELVRARDRRHPLVLIQSPKARPENPDASPRQPNAAATRAMTWTPRVGCSYSILLQIVWIRNGLRCLPSGPLARCRDVQPLSLSASAALRRGDVSLEV